MPTLAPLETEGHCLSVEFIDDTPCYIMSDGTIHIMGETAKAVNAHDGITCTALAQDAHSIITGGEDGRVCRIDKNGRVIELANAGSKWVNAVACGPQNSLAYSIGRNMWTIVSDKRDEFEGERSIEGLAFAPKGLRVASAHYNGVTLIFLGTKAEPTKLEWKGAHNAVTFSPDNRFVITTMQENALHGWRLADNQHLRMSGYPTKVKDWSWSNKGKWLATSGAAAAIVWPFTSKDGPMGKAPLELGTRASNLVTAVACHPEDEAVAVGFDDGMILLVRFADAKEVLLRRPGKGAITALRWDKKGYRLIFGAETGDCGLIDITA